MTDRTLHHLIGERFETLFQQQFPDFTKQSDNNGKPDFFNGQLWVETKTGYFDFGVRLKPRQLSLFRKLELPVLYALGYHDFAHSIDRLSGLGDEERQDILSREMNILRAYLVSDDVIRAIWNGENHVSKKSQVNYCMLKERFLSNLIFDIDFKRSGVEYSPWRYYRLKKSSIHLQPAPVFNHSPTPAYGLAVNSQDKVVMDFLRERGIAQ